MLPTAKYGRAIWKFIVVGKVAFYWKISYGAIIFVETVTDLLCPSGESLQIREKSGNVFVDGKQQFRYRKECCWLLCHIGISKVKISSWRDAQDLLEQGDLHRTTAITNSNLSSSRSHAALLVSLISAEPELQSSKQFCRQSTLTLVGTSY